jgi:hypothetical protein
MWILLIFFLILVFIFFRKRYDTEDDEEATEGDTQIPFGDVIDYLDCDGYWQMNETLPDDYSTACENQYSGICIPDDQVQSLGYLYHTFVVKVVPEGDYNTSCMAKAQLAATQSGIDPNTVFLADNGDILANLWDCGFPQCISCNLGFCSPDIHSSSTNDSTDWDPTSQSGSESIVGYCVNGMIPCTQCLYVDFDGNPTLNPTTLTDTPVQGEQYTYACDNRNPLTDCSLGNGMKKTLMDRLSAGSLTCTYKIVKDTTRVKCTPGIFYSLDTPGNHDRPRKPFNGLDTWVRSTDWDTGSDGKGPGFYFKTFKSDQATPVWGKLAGNQLYEYINKYVQVYTYPGYVFTYSDVVGQAYVNWIGDISTGDVTLIVKPTRYYTPYTACLKNSNGTYVGNCDPNDEISEISNSYIDANGGPVYADNKDLWPNMLLTRDFSSDAPERLMTCPSGYIPTIKSEILSHQPASGGVLLNMDGSTCGSTFCYIISGNGLDKSKSNRIYDWTDINDKWNDTTLKCCGCYESTDDSIHYQIVTTDSNGSVCSPGYYMSASNVCTLDTSTIPMQDQYTYSADGGIWMYALKYP